MTLDETYQIMGLLQLAYPSYYRQMDKATAHAAAVLWQEMFADDDFHEVQGAIKILMATRVESYPPSIGSVKEKLAQIRMGASGSDMTAQDAWVLVDKAVRGLDFMAPEKAFDKLPGPVQRAVGSPSVLKEWAMGDEDEFMTVIYSQFLKAFAIHQKREREMAAIPASVRSVIAGVADRMALGE